MHHHLIIMLAVAVSLTQVVGSAIMLPSRRSETERAFLVEGIETNVRADGRARLDYRYVNLMIVTVMMIMILTSGCGGELAVSNLSVGTGLR